MDAWVSSECLDRIVAEALAHPAVEVCGLLLGRDGRVAAIAPCRNVAADPARRFEIDPAALLAAHRRARAGGDAVLGHYHSHPAGRAEPSAQDAADAAPDGALWLIAAGRTVTAWRAGPDGAIHGRFAPLDLRVIPADAREAASIRGTAMTIGPVDFASLLCSRLCHDLLSPVGALNNGLELLADETDPAMRARCMELLADSARTSANKLKFFRLAFGAAGGFGDAVDPREARGAIEGLLGDAKRTTLGWLVEAPTMPKPAVKVLLNLALIANEALVRGGTLDIGAEETGGQLEIVVKIEGPRIILDPELRRALTEGGEVTARTAAAFLVRTLAADHGGSVQVVEPADNVMIFGAAMAAR